MKNSLIILLCLLAGSSFAIDRGQYKDVDPATRSWFKAQRNRSGILCCDIADGHLAAWKKVGSQYWVTIDGNWYEVPAEAVILNAGNPFDTAVVWYIEAGGIYHIRCFIPTSEI